MTTSTATAAAAAPVNEWATSRNGRLRIRLFSSPNGTFQVYALRAGTHDLAPHTRRGMSEKQARAYANDLWSAR